MVDFCMRYGNPSNPVQGRSDLTAGVRKICSFRLYPHYARCHIRPLQMMRFSRLRQRENGSPRTYGPQPYFDRPDIYPKRWPATSIEKGGLRQMETKADKTCCAPYHGSVRCDYLHGGDPYHLPVSEKRRACERTVGPGSTQIMTTFSHSRKFGPRRNGYKP